jgi:hypothetical protein
MKGSKVIPNKKPNSTVQLSKTNYFVTRRLIPGELLSSIAHFRFISNAKIELVNGIQD